MLFKMVYRGYKGSVEYNNALHYYYGNIEGTKLLVLYSGLDLESLGRDFRKAVDEYIEYEHIFHIYLYKRKFLAHRAPICTRSNGVKGIDLSENAQKEVSDLSGRDRSKNPSADKRENRNDKIQTSIFSSLFCKRNIALFLLGYFLGLFSYLFVIH